MKNLFLNLTHAIHSFNKYLLSAMHVVGMKSTKYWGYSSEKKHGPHTKEIYRFTQKVDIQQILQMGWK